MQLHLEDEVHIILETHPFTVQEILRIMIQILDLQILCREALVVLKQHL
jgi:hypothetical protein